MATKVTIGWLKQLYNDVAELTEQTHFPQKLYSLRDKIRWLAAFCTRDKFSDEFKEIICSELLLHKMDTVVTDHICDPLRYNWHILQKLTFFRGNYSHEGHF